MHQKHQAKDAYEVNLNTFKQLRHQVYQCYERSADALFELGMR
ncbi:MAG TPA: hypothetical protein VFV38_05055 [Ktedonobacteraceae bacterium]|nr:hypothetical protein [Ktedonobacteraceae bacterium]